MLTNLKSEIFKLTFSSFSSDLFYQFRVVIYQKKGLKIYFKTMLVPRYVFDKNTPKMNKNHILVKNYFAYFIALIPWSVLGPSKLL